MYERVCLCIKGYVQIGSERGSGDTAGKRNRVPVLLKNGNDVSSTRIEAYGTSWCYGAVDSIPCRAGACRSRAMCRPARISDDGERNNDRFWSGGGRGEHGGP